MITLDVLFPDTEKLQGSSIIDLDFDEDDIKDAIGEEVSSTSAAGPDKYPAILLINCSNALAQLLYLIWRKSMNQGTNEINELN